MRPGHSGTWRLWVRALAVDRKLNFCSKGKNLTLGPLENGDNKAFLRTVIKALNAWKSLTPVLGTQWVLNKAGLPVQRFPLLCGSAFCTFSYLWSATVWKYQMENSRNKWFINFKLCVVRSSTMTSHTIPTLSRLGCESSLRPAYLCPTLYYNEVFWARERSYSPSFCYSTVS